MALLSPRAKTPLHILQLLLVITVMGLTAPRLFNKSLPRTRASTMALGMGAKSLIIIQYQLLTEHVRRLHRWASLKAFTILNALEIVFWAAVAFLVIQGNIKACVGGIWCWLSWGVVGIAANLSILAVWVTAISWRELRASREQKNNLAKSLSNDPIEMS